VCFLKPIAARCAFSPARRVRTTVDSKNIDERKIIISANQSHSIAILVLSRLAVRFEVAHAAHEKQLSVPLVHLDFAHPNADRIVSRFDATTGSIRIDLGEFGAKKQDL
jgi:hypothetical protein